MISILKRLFSKPNPWADEVLDLHFNRSGHRVYPEMETPAARQNDVEIIIKCADRVNTGETFRNCLPRSDEHWALVVGDVNFQLRDRKIGVVDIGGTGLQFVSL